MEIQDFSDFCFIKHEGKIMQQNLCQTTAESKNLIAVGIQHDTGL